MRTNRNKAISHYQKEANLLRNDYDDYEDEEQDESEIPHNDDAVQIATDPVESPDSRRAAGAQGAAGATNMEAEAARSQGEDKGAESASVEGASEATGEVAESAEGAEAAESGAPAICPHVLSVYETVMLIQLKRMIKRNTKAFAVMLKILIQGDPKRKP